MTAILGFFQGTEMPTAGWWKALWPDPAKVLASTGLTDGADAIDLCSGDGWFTLPMAKVARHVFAIDIDRKLLDVARKQPEQAGVSNCTFIEGNAYDTPREETKILGEPRGPATALRMTPEATAAVVEPGGLKLREVVDVPPYHYGAIFEKLPPS